MQEPTKQENEIGKYLKWNCPSKPSTLLGEKVEYFIGKYRLSLSRFNSALKQKLLLSIASL